MICPRCDARWFVYADGETTLASQPDDLHTVAHSARPARPDDDAAAARPFSILRAVRPLVVAAAGVLAVMGAIGAREEIVRAVPPLAGVYAEIGLPVNVRGLAIATLVPRRLESDAVQISGEIRNVAQRRVGMPRIVYEVRDTQGAPLLTWSEPGPARSLGPGRTASFVSTPHLLPPESRSLLVRFEDDTGAPAIRVARRAE